MLWYSLVKRFERSEAVERFERFELASVYFGSAQAISLLHRRFHSKRTCFETLDPLSTVKFGRVGFRWLPQHVTSIGFDHIAMVSFEAKLVFHLVNKRQASDRESIRTSDHRASISHSPALAQPTGDVQFENLADPQTAQPV
jgi:hypothetical protein